MFTRRTIACATLPGRAGTPVQGGTGSGSRQGVGPLAPARENGGVHCK